MRVDFYRHGLSPEDADSAGGLAYSLYANDNAPRPAAYVNTGAADQAAIGTGSLPLNAWTHLAATVRGAASPSHQMV